MGVHAKPQAAVVSLVVFATGIVFADGFSFPPERRGNVVAQLNVRIADLAEKETEPIALTITVYGGETLEVEPVVLEDATDAWKATRNSSWTLDDGHVSWTQVVRLRQVKPGWAPLPSARVRFRDGPTTPWEEAEWLQILQYLQEAPSPEEMTPGENAAFRWLWIALGFTVVIVAGAVLWRLRRRPLPVLSAEERALKDLDAAEVSATDAVVLHTRLSEIVRRYLAERFQVPAPRQTTAEFLTGSMEPVPPAARPALADFFQRCDLAKFAPVASATAECKDTVHLARQVLRACEDGAANGKQRLAALG